MRLATLMVVVSVALACPARADDDFTYRQISFGSALTAGRISACTIDFSITFHDPTAPPRSSYSVSGRFVFFQKGPGVVARVTMQPFGDFRTKFTGIGRIGDVTLTAGDAVVPLSLPGGAEDQGAPTLRSDQVAALRTALIGDSTLAFTLSDPMRSFTLPFSLHSARPGGRTDDAAEAGLTTFDDCMVVLDRGSP